MFQRLHPIFRHKALYTLRSVPFTSSLLIMTIVGGAVAPVIMGYIADTTGSMAIAFLIPLVCYGVIGGYALSNSSVSSLAKK